MTFVLRSTAKTIVRCWVPSWLLATTGKTWRRSGRLKRTANVPSLRSLTGSPRRVTWRVRSGNAVNDQFGVELELEIGSVGRVYLKLIPVKMLFADMMIYSSNAAF